jgi:hypothetical protein
MAKFIKTFKEIIKDYSKKSKEINLLPLCHTTTEGHAFHIIAENLKSKKLCPIYGEYLVYFFYGRPSYITQKEIENYTLYPPITFIYDIKDMKSHKIRRILPFDSGGFHRYAMKPDYYKENFTHETPTVQILKGVVKLIYHSNNHYLNEEVNFNELSKHFKECLEMKEIAELYDRVKDGKAEVSQQVHTIELQYEKEVRVKPKYIILPYHFSTNQFWSENVKKEYPRIKVDFYGKEQILKKRGRALKGYEYIELMQDKVLEIIG